jgi:hypothetical protein
MMGRKLGFRVSVKEGTGCNFVGMLLSAEGRNYHVVFNSMCNGNRTTENWFDLLGQYIFCKIIQMFNPRFHADCGKSERKMSKNLHSAHTLIYMSNAYGCFLGYFRRVRGDIFVVTSDYRVKLSKAMAGKSEYYHRIPFSPTS